MSKKRTAQFSPNSEGPIFKQGRNTSKNIFQTPQSTPVVPPAVPPPVIPQVVGENPVNRFEESINDQLHCSMKSIPDETNVYTSPSIGFVIVDVYQRNGLPFDELVPKDTIKKIWTELGRPLSDVRILSCERFSNKYLRITYNLVNELSLSIAEITNSFESQIDIQIGNVFEVYSIRFPQFKELVCQLGQKVPVTFKRVPPQVSCRDLRCWLGIFGEVVGSFRYNI
jgi:hypothetical protein